MTIYANWARVGLTPFDLTLDLGYRTGNGPPDDFPVRSVMSLEHAKELGALLNDAIKDYEKEVGEIRDFGMQSVVADIEDAEDSDDADA